MFFIQSRVENTELHSKIQESDSNINHQKTNRLCESVWLNECFHVVRAADDNKQEEDKDRKSEAKPLQNKVIRTGVIFRRLIFDRKFVRCVK